MYQKAEPTSSVGATNPYQSGTYGLRRCGVQDNATNDPKRVALPDLGFTQRPIMMLAKAFLHREFDETPENEVTRTSTRHYPRASLKVRRESYQGTSSDVPQSLPREKAALAAVYVDLLCASRIRAR
jgi:hypothetical protein